MHQRHHPARKQQREMKYGKEALEEKGPEQKQEIGKGSASGTLHRFASLLISHSRLSS